MTASQRGDAPDAAASAAHPETRGIELIRPSERHGRAWELFGVWAAPNVSVLNFTVGATMILLGLELWQALLVIVVGSLPWILTGIVAISGPAAGTSGSVITRAMYGVIGNKLVVALTGWLLSAVFLALNWLASSFMGAQLLAELGWTDAVSAAIAVTVVVSAVTVLVAVYGHAFILRSYTVVTIALLAVFLVAVAFILPHADWGYRAAEPLDGVPLWSALTVGFTILAATPLSYINSGDMSRYLAADTPPSRVVGATALGGAIPSILFTSVGALLATSADAFASEAGIEQVMLGMFPAWFVPVFVIGVVVNTISLNGMTTYSSSMALQSIGIPLRRIPAAVVVGVLGTALTIVLVLSSTLLDAVNFLLQLLVVISGPTMAVYVTDILLRRNRYDGAELFDEGRGGQFWYTRGWGVPGLVAVVAGAVASALCLTLVEYTGPVSEALGYIDLTVPAGVLVAAAVYAGLSRTALGRRAFAGVPA